MTRRNGAAPHTETIIPETSLEVVERLKLTSESEPLRALAAEVLALRALLDAGRAPDLETQIDRAVAAMLARGDQKNDKGEHLVGAKEIDAAVKWFATKRKAVVDEAPEQQLGGALGRTE